ncbi:MAG: HAD family hydrolase [Verrucomicrobia bacterium]|nr:MAG: HAD family hydrolase [Verrucomicrobiota bacterium]
MKKHLLLWDIDGTLFHADRAGEIALLEAINHLYGIQATSEGVEFGGRTEVHVVESLLRVNGIAPTHEAIHRVFEAYIDALARTLPTRDATPLPGVIDILEAAAARPDIVQGLLTGNLTDGARIKLEHFDAWHYFAFGAFGEESADRTVLAANALRRAAERYGHAFSPTRTWVIGDTPHDITCGKAIGANTIAVATGRHSVDALAALHPTAVLPDLRDTAAFFAIIDRAPISAS